MPEYLHPGVYVEEVSSGVRPIEGVSTSTAGFIGVTAKGVPNKATFISSWTEFVRKFGDLIENSYLPYAVSQFFSNGGKRCYIVRVLNDASAVAAGFDLPDRETNVPARSTLHITAKGSGLWGNDLMVRVEDGTENPTKEFKLVVYHEGNPVEVFDNLSMDTDSSNYLESNVNDASEYIEVKDLNAHAVFQNASRTSTNALAEPVPFNGGGEAITVEMPDGTTNSVTFTGNTPLNDVLTALNNAWGVMNLMVSLTAASSPPANRLVIRANAPGFDRYFIVSGPATGVGRPLEGLAGFAQGSGAAIGGTLKSVAAAGGFIIPIAPDNRLTFTVHGDPFNVDLTPGANRSASAIANELNSDFQTNRNRILVASAEGNRITIATTNKGTADSALAIAGTANVVLNFMDFQRASAVTAGQGRSEPAFVQSDSATDENGFLLTDGANFSIVVNNGTLGANTSFTVTFNAATIPNLQNVAAQTIATTINNAAGATGVMATVVNKRIVIRQGRRGNYYKMRILDGFGSPNIRLNFISGDSVSGSTDGDKASPYFRPGFNIDASTNNQPWPLINGDDGSPVVDFDYIGTADKKSGLHALDDITDVNFICIPGNSTPDVIGKAVGYCKTRRDCFFIADAPGKQSKEQPRTEPPVVRDFLLNKITTKNSYGALYYSWLEIEDPIGAGRNPKRFVPPSGFVAGMYARIDNTRGVWKAPAGTEATIIGALGLEYSVTDSEQDILNPYGVNCIRQFPASGLVVWGARTLGAQLDPEWRYVPVRRYAIYLEQSIYRGTQWAVFEPNDQPLWDSLKANIEDFMMGEFRKGALAGKTPEQAFAVKCDADLNPQSEVNAGRVNMEVKFAPLKPAEFVIIRISQKTQRPGS